LKIETRVQRSENRQKLSKNEKLLITTDMCLEMQADMLLVGQQDERAQLGFATSSVNTLKSGFRVLGIVKNKKQKTYTPPRFAGLL
jgi:hypothetical protein